MKYTQLIEPDTGTGGAVGECLSFAESVFGAAHWFPNATEAWESTSYKHPGRDFPEGVSVLLWWSYTAPISGVWADYGHVAIRLPDGRILSSPYRNGTPSAILNSIEELEQIYSSNGKYPLTYRGWTEDISNVRVVKGQEMITKEQYLVGAQAVGTEYGKDFNYDPNISVDQFVNFLLSQSTVPTLRSQVDELGKAVTIKDNDLVAKDKEIESLKAQTGDNTKWETLKALIRELIKG